MKVKEADSDIVDYSKLQPQKDIGTLEQELALCREDPNLPIDKKLKAKVDKLTGIIHLQKVYAKNFAVICDDMIYLALG